VEVNIFDLERDLYGERIAVQFLERIRGDMRFDGLDALKEQLHRDKVNTMEMLGHSA
jgi:riboflavin kinase/FMN adenylyltransferase